MFLRMHAGYQMISKVYGAPSINSPNRSNNCSPLQAKQSIISTI
jgi:hypothetical protein